MKQMPIRRTTPMAVQNSNFQREKRRRKPQLRRVIFALVFSGLAVGSVALGMILKDIPDPGDIGNQRGEESTKIYDRTGSNLLYEFGEIKRTWVPLEQISPKLIHATLAIEDRDFYKHGGLSFRGIIRSAFDIARGKSLRSGSTITQQLVKVAILSPEQTLTRKIREVVLAVVLEKRLSKDKILETYLNVIPYGANTGGIEAASQTYFGTSAKDLTAAQAALLAAMPKAPTYYSPYGSHVENLFARQQYILSQMAELNYITKEEAETAKKTEITFKKRADRITAPHFVFYVREQLEKEFGENILSQGGLKITTTLDFKMQRAAEDAVAKQAPKNAKRKANNAALVSLSPKNGDILAMVGSVDYFNEENDGNVNVAIRPRSPGSAFKPFVYAELLRKGYSTETVFADVPIDFGTAEKAYRPYNYNKSFSGPVTMRQALARSLNIPAVEALYMAGMKDTLAFAKEMGFPSLDDPDRYGLSLVLGGGEVRLLDLVSAYSVFAAEGVKHPTRAILKIEDPRGRIIFDATNIQTAEDRVVDAEVTRMITDILSDNNARAATFGTGSPLQLGPRPVAAKTGTAQEYRDGWTVGYTPSVVAGVWVGNNDNTPMQSESGVEAAAPIWNSFMRATLTGTPIENFTKPKKLEGLSDFLNGKIPQKKLRYDKDSGVIAPEDCPLPVGQTYEFISFHSPLYYINKSTPRASQPENPAIDPMFAKWEAGVNSWREKWNKEHANEPKMYVDKIPDVVCDPSLTEGMPEVRFVSPEAEIIKNSSVKIMVEISSDSPIKKVEFFVNDQKIGERTEEPWEILYKLPAGSTSGEIILKARATNEAGKIGQRTKRITINSGNGSPRVSVLAPWPNETITPQNFPYDVKISARDEKGVKEVDALFKQEGQSKTIRIGKTQNPEQNGSDTYNIGWKEAPAPGKYELWSTATNTTGGKSQTVPIVVTIP